MADLRNTRNANAARNAAVDAVTALANSGKLRIYDGTQPAAGGAVTTQNLLWEGTFASTAFNAASNGTASLAATVSAVISTGGTASWFRVTQSNGTTILWDGSVGDDTDSDTHNLELTNNVLGAGNTLNVTALTYSVAAQGV